MGLLGRILLTAVSLLLLTAGPAVGQATPQTFTVVSTTDAPDDNPGDQICRTPSIAANGPCTLRAAIQEANFFNTADTIILPAGTYPLTLTGAEEAAASGDLDITQPVTIDGAGARSTIVDMNTNERVFDVRPGGSKVAIEGLTMTDGSPAVGAGPGAGLQNGANTVLTEVAVTGNDGGTGTAGGGVASVGGSLIIERSEISGNTAGATQGGGGILITGGSLQVSNSTISGNAAPQGGGILISGTTPAAVISHSTITQNNQNAGAAVQHASNGGQTQFSDTVVGPNGGNGINCSGAIGTRLQTLGHNIETGATCGFTNAAAGDRQQVDTLLGALGYSRAEDQTQTHVPLPGSPAIDGGNATGCPATDQRGLPRPSGATCDSGAVEVQAVQQPPPPPPAPAALFLEPSTADRTPGETHTATAIAQNNDGSPASGRSVRFEIDGVNEGAGAVTTDASGRAQISWKGIHEGTDVLKAYVDANTNQTLEPSEPTAQSSVNWVLPAPVQGRTANIEPVSGRVRITVRPRRSGSGKVSAAGATSLLTEARQVPLDTVVDVRKGRVRMTTTANRAGDVQKGEFYGGVYTTRQTGSSVRPVTELRLTESLICQPNTRRGRITASRARSRRLWGNGRGRYRTRGRHSTATVRGTIWLQKDTCTKTTTVVRQGVVDVRDLAKRKTVRVRAGKRYVARRASRRR